MGLKDGDNGMTEKNSLEVKHKKVEDGAGRFFYNTELPKH